MIYVVTHHDHTRTVWRLKRKAAERELAFVRPIPYRRLFRDLRAPLGHYVFTDFDRLTAYEVQVAATLANRLTEAAPAAHVLNHPAHVLERYPMLQRLKAEGLNDFNAYRLDGTERPQKYPVFVRAEDDCLPLESPLIETPEELEATIARLRSEGVPMKRRIAVEFCAQADEDGYYRKYSAFRVGDQIVPHHVLVNDDWYVKWGIGRSPDPRLLEQETRFVVDNPHEERIRRVFDIAGIRWGRIDYAMVDGSMQAYEINTNFTPPRLGLTGGGASSPERRRLVRERFMAGLREIETPLSGPSTISFALPRPRHHKLDRLPLRFAVQTFYERLKLALGK